jgi:hypothetical protein
MIKISKVEIIIQRLLIVNRSCTGASIGERAIAFKVKLKLLESGFASVLVANAIGV